MLLTILLNNSRGKQIAAADACVKGSHISWGWGKPSERRAGQKSSFHLFPSQRAQAGAESTQLLPSDWLSVSVSPESAEVKVNLNFIYLMGIFNS